MTSDGSGDLRYPVVASNSPSRSQRGFRIRSLPYRGIRPGVTVETDEHFTGWFTRNRKGGVKFGYADLGSSCCHYYPVTLLTGGPCG